MVVPIYKKWEASLARIQIVRQEKIIQLIAFFSDFQHGTCMNFVLKGTDHIESFGRSGKFGIRIVDAKFALPKMDEDPGSDFVCLDMPEYPIEHDDITITFDKELGEYFLIIVAAIRSKSRAFSRILRPVLTMTLDRTNFKVALPGSVREPSRMGSLRR
jgi:hypothetical protein